MSLAFGLTVRTAAYAIGYNSGWKLHRAVSIGLWVGSRFPVSRLTGYIAAQVLDTIAAGEVFYVIGSGGYGLDLAKGFASNGYGAHSPGRYSLVAALLTDVVITNVRPAGHPRRHRQARASGSRLSRSASLSRQSTGQHLISIPRPRLRTRHAAKP